ncbi:hypothetical protein BBP00_00004066 [Phytophthora kernoviae]|uniref:WW domain-containing protein n=1 Tax=Phytophthora kernoviae TaxID=325452 RepID=A0A3F2RSS1_9STRA|nr:hypothetical protein BBP00_00004066 [Phytophthora kernoviae]
MVAKHRRQSRRAKLRRKTKKVKVTDTVAPVSSEADECPVEVLAVEADVRTTDASIEGAEKISVGHVIAEGDINVSSDVPAISVDVTVELPSPPMEDDIKSLARNDSCEYALDLFDGSNGALDVELQAQNDDNGVMVPIGTAGGQVSTNFADPQTLGTGAATPKKNEEVDNGRDSTVLQLEQEVERVERTLQLTIEPTIKLSSANKVESSLQQVPSSVHGRFSTLTFDKEPKATDAVIMNTPKGPEEVMGSQWGRYVDNTTSKSWYFNPSTNISQWTTPEGASIIDNAKASSPHVIPTMQQGGAPDVEAVQPSDSKSTPEPLGTWQEFLDEASGQLFYYNAKTGESSWVPPLERCDPIGVVASPESASTAAVAAGAASAWVMYIDPATQAPYYVNVDTLATRWEPPAEFAVASTLAPSEANATTTADEDELYATALDSAWRQEPVGASGNPPGHECGALRAETAKCQV